MNKMRVVIIRYYFQHKRVDNCNNLANFAVSIHLLRRDCNKLFIYVAGNQRRKMESLYGYMSYYGAVLI
jgi:hypothetical protein